MPLEVKQRFMSYIDPKFVINIALKGPPQTHTLLFMSIAYLNPEYFAVIYASIVSFDFRTLFSVSAMRDVGFARTFAILGIPSCPLCHHITLVPIHILCRITPLGLALMDHST